MSDVKRIRAPFDEATARSLRAGDRVLITGTIIAARDAAHISGAQHIASPLGGAVVDHGGVTIADDTAHIVALQQRLFALIIGKAAVPAGG